MTEFELQMLLNDDRELGAALRTLPREAPKGLTTSLRVLASRERQRRLAARNSRWGSLSGVADGLALQFANLLRPLALPLAGGVCSAILLFGLMLGSTVPVHANTDADVPTVLKTSASVTPFAPISAWDEDSEVVVVDVMLDDQGRMIDYAIVSGVAVLQNIETRRRLENKLLFTEFVPATAFGMPTTSRLCLLVGTSRIEVKG